MVYDNGGYNREKDERPTTLEMQNEPPQPNPTRDYGQVGTKRMTFSVCVDFLPFEYYKNIPNCQIRKLLLNKNY